MIFLSKNGEDQYINMLAHSCGKQPVDDVEYAASREPIWIRGILKYKLIQRCWQDRRDFYFVDTGYFGNGRWKNWHRITRNNLVQTEIIECSADRWEKLGLKIAPWTPGEHIIVAAPDEKPCKFYGIDLETWINETVNTIKKYTDRPIVVRRRAPRRIDRIATDTLASALVNAHALVTYNSNAAVESVLLGKPVFCLAPNAAAPVALNDLSKIETPYYADRDKLQAWAHSLAYSQFNNNELQDGTAVRMVTNQ